MTDTAIIRLELGIPAGSPVCGGCHNVTYGVWAWFCGIFDDENGDAVRLCKDSSDPDKKNTAMRCAACLAAEQAEQRFSPDPPTEPGWYKAKLMDHGPWEMVLVEGKWNGPWSVYRVGISPAFDLSDFGLWSTKRDMPGGE